MFWQEDEPNENFPIRRFVSRPTARWEIGLTPMAFGVRIRMGINGDCGCTLDYCCGSNHDEWFLYLGIICGICIFIPEDIPERELSRLFPYQKVKPLSKDRECMDALWALRDELCRQSYDIPKKDV